jgi:hypothetical protein
MTLEISQKTQQLLQIEAERRHTSPERLAEQLIQAGLLTKKRDASHLTGKWSEEDLKVFEEERNLDLKIFLENSRGFDVFSGLWTQQEADEFAANTQDFSKIDEGIWRETNPT